MTCVVAVFSAGMLFQAYAVALPLDACRSFAASFQAQGYGVRRETFKAKDAPAAPATRPEDVQPRRGGALG